MIIRFDSLDMVDVPKFALCNPGSVYSDGIPTKMVGYITDTSDEEFVFNFNETSELNFRVNRVIRDDNEIDEHTYNMFKAIQNRRLIFVDDIGYFIITNVSDGTDDDTQYKDVSARSIDAELEQKNVPFIKDGTYRFLSDPDVADSVGIFETVVSALPLWTIGDVDSSIASKYRTFEDVDDTMNCLGFMIDEMQEAFECIIIFDIVNRTINVYDQNDYVKRTDIHITKDDVIKSLKIEDNSDDLYTAISVRGDENVTISAINPLGTNTIYKFDNYLDWMSSQLKSKVITWQNQINTTDQYYYELNQQYYDTLDSEFNTNAEIDRYKIQLTMYKRCRDNIVAESDTSLVEEYNAVIVDNGGSPITVYQEVADTLSSIDDKMANCQSNIDRLGTVLETITTQLSFYMSQINTIRSGLSIENYFSQAEIDELQSFIFEGTYSDDYVVITDIMTNQEKFEQMKVLYDRAKNRLESVSKPTQEFDIDVENFLFEKSFEHWSTQLETGCIINVELDTDDIAMLFLSSITVNYEDNTLSMKFGNRFNKFDPRSLFDDALGDISKATNSIGYIKEALYPIKSGEFNDMRAAIQSSRDLTMNSAMTSENEEVVIDGSGYTGRKKAGDGFDPHQVKITGKTIVFTDDAWESSKVAIGELVVGDRETVYGINAEAIIGNIIMGNNLKIYDSNGNELMSVVDGRISQSVSELSSNIDTIDSRVTDIEQESEEIRILVEKDVDHVVTSTGFTFDENGLSVHKSGEEMKNLLDNTGMYVTRSDSEVLTANNEGVRAINLLSKQYLIIGSNSRFEDYTDGNNNTRTACFYIG